MDPAAAKQQIVERVRQANNILVTVSSNPTVDQLAACIGLTLLVNKMNKHATAVFSGHVPSTIEFLQPEKTLETNTDSLRDFIISLDKDKADKLRYKVEDDIVRIFITPYRTSLSEKDLVFSQGDFNVEVVIALGIKERSQVDAAITAHGRILHDATVICLNTGQDKMGDIGQINWQDSSASSLSEMIVSISEAFGGGLIDNQIATAFLTGIVAETNRFANTKTTPKVMTMSAQLMAAGANQQLIVSKLEQPLPQAQFKPAAKTAKSAEMEDDGTLSINHEIEAKLKESSKRKSKEGTEAESDEIHIDEQGNLVKPLEPSKKNEADSDEGDDGQPQTPLEATSSESEEESKSEEKAGDEPSSSEPDESEMPGSHTMLNPAARQPFLESPLTANTQPEWQDPYDSVPIDPLNGDGPGQERIFEHKTVIKPLSEETAAKAGGEAAASDSVDQARKAVADAQASTPFDPAFQPEAKLGVSDLGDPVHQPEPVANGTPSLPLPGKRATVDEKPKPTAGEPVEDSTPPPIPPPLIPIPDAKNSSTKS